MKAMVALIRKLTFLEIAMIFYILLKLLSV